MIRFGIAQIEALAPFRPPGYVEAVIAAGNLVEAGSVVDLSRDAYDRLRAEYSPSPWQLPDAAEIASNFSRAILRVARAGFRTVSRDEYSRRMNLCRGCPAWTPGALPGLGSCERCKCGQVKHWLASESCPLAPPIWGTVP